MKSLTLVSLIFIISLPVSVFAQKAGNTTIDSIKAQFIAINKNLSACKKITRNDMDQSTEGGEVRAYLLNNALQKITGTYYGETFKATVAYYFHNNRLIFYYMVSYQYKVPIYIDTHTKIDSTHETRYYFNSGKIIKYLNQPHQSLSLQRLNQEARETAIEVDRLKKLISNKKND